MLNYFKNCPVCGKEIVFEDAYSSCFDKEIPDITSNMHFHASQNEWEDIYLNNHRFFFCKDYMNIYLFINKKSKKIYVCSSNKRKTVI